MSPLITVLLAVVMQQKRFPAEDVAVHAGHLCWACSLQCEGSWAKMMRDMTLRSSLI